MKKRELTMTIHQFCEMERGNLTLRDIELQNGFEGFATHVKKDKYIEKLVVISMACMLMLGKIANASTNVEGKIAGAGQRFFNIIRGLGYWLCLIGCVVEVLKSVSSGGSKDIGKIIMKYLLIFGSLYFMPWAFDLIKEMFE
ncbi:MAG: hypothetical protein ACRC7N_03615 [Clostridium sp.]